MNRKLVLANGVELAAKGFGSSSEVIAELVFNTSMVGYQEILSDPSYYEKMVVMTYPLIGNYGIIDEDYESKYIGPKAFIVREYNDKPSNFRYTKTLNELLEENNIPGLTHLDTRKLTRILQQEGSMLGLVCDEDLDHEEAMKKLQAYQKPSNSVSLVSCRKKWYSRCANPKYNVVAIDCGINYSMIRQLNKQGCNVTIVPYNTSYEAIMMMNPDGVFISDGPGNPEENKEVIELIQKLQGKKPIFAVGLAHNCVALANGLEIYKMKSVHCGSNHSVIDLATGKISIVSQNHSYAICKESIQNKEIKITHLNVLDGTIEGLKLEKDFIFSVQYHPDFTSSPQDCQALFDCFLSNMDKLKGENENA